MNRDQALYTSAQVRELDRRAIEQHGIPAGELMERAGAAAFVLLRTRWPRARRLAVLCGPGNNGGDGYVVARLAQAAGFDVRVHALESPRSQEARAACDACRAGGVAMGDLDRAGVAQADVVVDGLLGIGLARPVEGAVRAAIEAIRSGSRVLALDVPSGLNADTGAVMGKAVRADATMVFIALKAGLYTGAGREHAGEICFDDLGVPAEIYTGLSPLAHRLIEADLECGLVRRARHGHKGDYGHVLVVGGGPGMPGAARLAGEAAYRAGAGLVTVAVHPDHLCALGTERPELLVHGVDGAGDLAPLLARADVVALGPGLGRDAWAQRLMSIVMEAKRPLVVDADALNLLAADPMTRSDWVLTPHPGEAGRLLGRPTTEIQSDRYASVREIAERYGGVCVLKGSGTLLAGDGTDALWLCDRGNPGMASGGMGDVLTGAVAGLVAQGLSLVDAARIGVWTHAAAGDDVARAGEAGMLASDLFIPLQRRLNRLRDAARA